MDEKRLFGEIAIQMKYVSVAQVRQALEIQREMRRSGEGHKLIGVLLVELGYMTPDAVIEVMALYDRERAESARLKPVRNHGDESGSSLGLTPRGTQT